MAKKLDAVQAQFKEDGLLDGLHPERYIDDDDELRARCWVLFDTIDSNSDNEISYIEMINWWKRKDKETNGHVTISDEVLMETRTKFRQYDTNDSGSIDRDELAGLLRALHLEKYIPPVAEIENMKGNEGILGEAPVKSKKKKTVATGVKPVAAAANGEETIVEGDLRKLMLSGRVGLSTKLVGAAKTGTSMIAGTDVPVVGNKSASTEDAGDWSDTFCALGKTTFSWRGPADPNGKAAVESGSISLADVKRVTPVDVAAKDTWAFEIAVRDKSANTTVYTFAAQSDDERKEWMDSFKLTILQEVPKDKLSKYDVTVKADVAGRVSTEELRKQIREAFSALDTDNSNTLSTTEIAAVGDKLGKPLTSAEQVRAMQEMDKDDDGVITLEEFSNWWVAQFSGAIAEGTKLAAFMAQFSDASAIEGVCYHPSRYVDPEDEMRARVWALFEEIDGNHVSA